MKNHSIFIYLLLCFSFNMYSQCLSNEAEYKSYLKKNISKLDQIEGIWNFECKRYIDYGTGNKENAGSFSFKAAIIRNGDAYKLCNIDETNINVVEFFKTASNDIYIYKKKFVEDHSYYTVSANTIVKNGYYLELTLDLTDKLHKDYAKAYGKETYDRGTVIENRKALKLFPTSDDYNLAIQQEQFKNSKSSGTGFALTNDGMIVTNYHVIENGTSIKIKGINGDFSKTYNAVVMQKDPINDLAILKISEPSFKLLGKIPYIIIQNTKNVGESVNVLGFPLTATMGEEIKYTNGTISSKSGYQGDISCYQISAPVQPGNSGGPLFDSNGNIIGIVSSKHRDAENASYAIKSSYLLNTAESLTTTPKLNTLNTMAKISIQDKIKLIKQFVYIIEVSYN